MTLFARFLVVLLALCVAVPPQGVQAREASRRPVGVILASELPPQARETLMLIREGGPFPYGRDGSVFANRERLLPAAPQGSYREYTVRTPGRRDRGARRIVSAAGGELYYTADHYRSFRLIRE